MDTNTTTPPVQDADIVDQTNPNPSTSDSGATTILTDLESLIKSHITGIDQRKTELKKLREMVNDALANDPTYQEHDKVAKEAAKVKSATKSQILKLPQNQTIVAKTHETVAEVKEMEEALSEYLREFGRISGANEIETDDGQVREIVFTAKLIKKSNPR